MTRSRIFIEEAMMSGTRQGDTWGEAALAGLPHLLFAPIAEISLIAYRFGRLFLLCPDPPFLGGRLSAGRARLSQRAIGSAASDTDVLVLD